MFFVPKRSAVLASAVGASIALLATFMPAAQAHGAPERTARSVTIPHGTDSESAAVSTLDLSNPALAATFVGAGLDTGSLRTMEIRPAGSGVNSLEFKWWGVVVKLDAFWTNKLVSTLNAGAGAAGIASVLAGAGIISSPAAVPTGVTAGILALGAGVIGFCSNSNGVTVSWTYNGVPWCGGQ